MNSLQLNIRRELAVCMVAGILGVLSVLNARAQSDGYEVSNFKIPTDYDDDGNMKCQLFGDYAKMKPGGVVDITTLKIEYYNKDQVILKVTAPQCTYNQTSGVAQSDTDVKIVREKAVVTGTGFLWKAKEEQFNIYSNVKVVLSSVRKRLDPAIERDIPLTGEE